MKNIFRLLSLVLMLAAMVSCTPDVSQTAASQPPVSESPSRAETSASDSADASAVPPAVDEDPRIGFITQEYIGENIAEIPYIEYDGALNASIESINRSLNQGIQQVYEAFMAQYTGERDWMEIRSYPFTTDRYLQMVVTWNTFPTYGNDGELLSINYDKEIKEWLTTDMALDMAGITLDDLSYQVGQLFEPNAPTLSIEHVKLSGFLIHDGQEKPLIEFLLQITLANSSAEPGTFFYSFTPEQNELFELNPFCLFDPSEMDQMDPPLSYQKN